MTLSIRGYFQKRGIGTPRIMMAGLLHIPANFQVKLRCRTRQQAAGYSEK